MSAFRGRKVVPLVAAGLTVGGASLLPGLAASAASVTAAPVEVWTTVDTPLPFSGSDPVSGVSRALAIDFGGDETTCVVNTPATNDFSGDCAGARLAVPAGLGTITVDDSQVAYVGGGVSGGGDFTITGPKAALQAALASVTYTPPAAFTTDGAGPVPFTVEGYDAGGGGLSTRTVDINVTDMTGATDAWFTQIPDHVYTPRGVQLDFTATPDPVTGLPRSIAIDPPFDSSGCTYVPATMQGEGHCLVAFVDIAPPGTSDRGTLLVGADMSGFAYTPLGIAGSFSVVATEDQVQSVLSSLSYLPPDATFVTPDDDPVPVHIALYEAFVVADEPLLDPETAQWEIHDEYIYVHVIDPPVECPDVPATTEPADTPDPTDPPVETTVPDDTTDTTDPPTETTEPDDTTETTEPERDPQGDPQGNPQGDPTTTTTTSTPIFGIPIPTIPIPIPTFTIPTPIPTFTIPQVPVLTAPPSPIPGPGPFGYSRPMAPLPAECPPDTTVPGDTVPGNTVPGGSLPATGAPTLLIVAFAGLLTASGAALLATRGTSTR